MQFSYDKTGPLILDIPAFRIERGKSIFLRGKSGSGKSTLLGLISGVIPSQIGTIEVLETSIPDLRRKACDQFRVDRMGVIFQMFNLLPYLSVIDNVLLPCRFSQSRASKAQSDFSSIQDAALTLLERLGMPQRDFKNRATSDLSVGQQQRVAAARALIGSPDIILADEPTSALDTETQSSFINLLKEETRKSGASLIFVSHDQTLANQFDAVVDLGEINRAMTTGVAA